MPEEQRPRILERALRIALQNHAVSAMIAVTSMFITPWYIRLILLYLGGILYLISNIVPYIDNWRPKPRVVAQGKAVFITGCDSGFGYHLAQRLDDAGLEVYAGCLFPEKEGAQMLKTSCSARLHVLPLDVTSDNSVENAVKYVKNHVGNKKLWSIVNNAGINDGGEIAWTSMEKIQRVLDVNVCGVVRTTKAFLPLLCKDKGRIVTVASAAGRYSFPIMIPYCMSKHATIAFCEGLRNELYRFGVKVIIVEPFFFKTPLTREDFILSLISKSWDESSKEIQELYPQNYKNGIKRNAVKFLRLLSSDKPQAVVNCLEEAVLAADPKYSYNPGTFLSRTAMWFFLRLPKEFVDAAMNQFQRDK